MRGGATWGWGGVVMMGMGLLGTPAAGAAQEDSAPDRVRPQIPHPPFPYHVEEVRYTNPSDGVTLAGTLTVPAGDGPFPAAVLLSVAGPDDRDQSHSGHRPFLVLADHLTRRGIAVLRSDDRGVGGSGGSLLTSTLEDRATDALAAIHLLRGRAEIDPARVGVIGNSEGGAVGPLAAVREPEAVAFVILLSGPGLPGHRAVVEQQVALARSQGFSEEGVDSVRAWTESLVAAVGSGDDPAAVDRLRAVLSAPPPRRPASLPLPPGVDAQVRLFLSPWYSTQLAYDPGAVLPRVEAPVLALAGTLDPFLPPDLHLPAIGHALASGRSPDYTVRRLPGVNHVVQPARTGSLVEYASLEHSFAPSALEAVSHWLRSRFGDR